mgnify:CR=1 FL=1
MGAFSIWHWIIVLIIVLLLFGKGKIPTLMADMAKGIKSFKKNMSEEDTSDKSALVRCPESPPVRTLSRPLSGSRRPRTWQTLSWGREEEYSDLLRLRAT